MARVRVPVVLGPIGMQAIAPTFQEIPHSYLPIVPGKISADGVLSGVAPGDPALANLTVMVEIPDSDLTADLAAIDPKKVAAKYPNHWLVTNGIIK